MKSVVREEISVYLPMLSDKQQSLVLEMVKSLLNIDKTEKRISLAQYNKELDAALKEVKAGKGVSHDEVVARAKKWLKGK